MDQKKNVYQEPPKKQSELPIILLCVLGGLLALAIFGYAIVRPLVFILTMGSDYTDTNGADNYSLEVLGEKDLIGEHNSQMYLSGIFFEGKSTLIEGALEDFDRDICTVQAGIFDGIYTAQATKIEKDRLMLNVVSQVEAGNFEIFILIDDAVAHRVEANCEKDILLENIQGKTVLVKIVGEGADFAFEVTRTY